MAATAWHWNVDPVLLPIYGKIAIRWYSLLFMGGILLGAQGFKRLLTSEGRDPALVDPLLQYVVIGTLVGARLGHMIFYELGAWMQDPWLVFRTWEGGLASHGGYLGVVISLYLFRRKYLQPGQFWWLADRIAIFALLAGAFIRLGNLMNSEIVGLPTDLPWGVVFVRWDNVARHPSQVYEAVGYFGIFMIMRRLYQRTCHLASPRPGALVGWAVLMGFGFRFVVEFFKADQAPHEASWVLNTGQWLSLPLVALGLFLIQGGAERLGGGAPPKNARPHTPLSRSSSSPTPRSAIIRSKK